MTAFVASATADLVSEFQSSLTRRNYRSMPTRGFKPTAKFSRSLRDNDRTNQSANYSLSGTNKLALMIDFPGQLPGINFVVFDRILPDPRQRARM